MDLRLLFHRSTERFLAAGLIFNAHAERQGFKHAIRCAMDKVLKRREPFVGFASLARSLAPGGHNPVQDRWSEIDARLYPDLAPIGVYPVSADGESFTSIVTDSIGKKSLFGGVGTALILGTLLANRRSQPLRIITRTEPGSAEAYGQLIRAHGLKLESELVLAHSPAGTDQLVVPQHQDDLYITTSWWTTASSLQRLSAETLLYLIQEDERCFYPYGDQYLACEQVMAHPKLTYAVNSRFLWDHLCQSGFANIQQNGMWFEPCFQVQQRPSSALKIKGKKTFFFYARPRNPRNLYRTGMRAINDALLSRVLDPSKWQVVLVGSHLEPICFDDGTIPRLVEGLSWSDYLKLLQGVDLGLSLMATPHPSYPPLDLAASGAVVVTNTFANKTSLSSYSGNIFSCEPTSEAIVGAIREAVARVENPQQVQDYIDMQSFGQSWPNSLEHLLVRFSRHV